MKVKVFPYQEKIGMGNIIWAERDRGDSYYRASKYERRNGKFPPGHPVGGTRHVSDYSQLGSGTKIDAFRDRGYWASCFPEGDGITWRPLHGQSAEQCVSDILECFGWDIEG